MYYEKTKWTSAQKCNHKGYIFDSKFEAGYAQELDMRVMAKDIKNYDKQIPIDLTVNGYKICTYKIDFIVYHNDGLIEYVETKGYMTPVWKIKWKLFEAIYSEKPNTKLTVILQSNKHKIPRAKKQKL